MSRFGWNALLVGMLVVVTASCTIHIAAPPPHEGGPVRATAQPQNREPALHQRSIREIGPISNNEVVRLERAVYVGDLVLNGNRIRVIGQGPRRTVIQGQVVISGNSCELHNLTVNGDLILSGNNNDVRGAEVRGRVSSHGNNNRY